MKKLLSFLAILMIATVSAVANSSLVVTLTHEKNTTEYYGINAFVEAVKTSVDGDFITLSRGTFKGTTINKSLSIRGAGVEGEESTIIVDDVILARSNDVDNRWLKIEGIKFTGTILIERVTRDKTNKYGQDPFENLMMVKCDINMFDSYYWEEEYYNRQYGTLKNANFINCRIMKSIHLYHGSEASFINCVVGSIEYGHDKMGSPKLEQTVNLLNSVFISNTAPRYFATGNFTAKNSIILVNIGSYAVNSSYPFPSGSYLDHCIVTGYLVKQDPEKAAELFLLNNNNLEDRANMWKPMNEVFSTLTEYKVYDETNDYSLADGAFTILGTDYSQRGIYGGSAPYNNIVSYPRFTTFEVSDKAVDGIIHVKIVVQ